MSGVTMATLEVSGQTLVLLPEKAVFLPGADTLVVADAQLGISVPNPDDRLPPPAGSTTETLTLLSGLVKRLEVRRIIFLGDILPTMHALSAETLQALTRWRERHGAVEITVVRGATDDVLVPPPLALDIQVCAEPLRWRGLALAHRPRPMAGAYVLAGHLHPCVSAGSGPHANDWQRVPCFWFTERIGVLPAFGAYTGMQTIRPRQGERVFLASGERVVELNAQRRH